MSKKHARLGASNAYRWINCPGSIALSEKAPEPTVSIYAAEGTAAHSVFEGWLRNIHVEDPACEITKEMNEHGREAAAWVKHEMPPGAFLHVEEKIDLTHLHPDMWGTLDAAIVDEFGTLHVIDYKYGAGIAVDAEENWQLIFYALGMSHRYHHNFDRVRMTIIQPRAYHEKGPIRSWEIPIKELLEYGLVLSDAADATEKPDARLEAGGWCRFCPAATVCPEISTRAIASAQIDFAPEKGVLALPAPTSRELVPYLPEILLAADRIETWISEIRKYAFHLIECGETIPGFKLVEKRGTRRWVNAEQAAKDAKRAFGAIAFKTELLSPAQLEKLVGRNSDWIESRVSVVSSGLTLVPDSDKRDARVPAIDDFKPRKGETKMAKKKKKKVAAKKKVAKKKKRK